jgi:hypothetical protein
LKDSEQGPGSRAFSFGAVAGQLCVMAAIVATMLCLPVGALLAGIAFLVFGLPLHAFVTFGGHFSEPLGLIVWWAAGLAPALVYALICSRA